MSRNNGVILAIDDTAVSLSLLVSILSGEGYTVLQADGGETALAVVRERRPDLILLDIQMAGMDGMEVCRRLKGNAATKNIPVIFISAFADTETWAAGLQLGAADYLRIPFLKAELLSRVATHLSLAGMKQAPEKQSDRLREAEAHTVEIESRYEELFEKSPIGKSMTSLDGNVVPNRALCEMLGYSMDELRTMKWQDITPGEDIRSAEAVLTALKSGAIEKAHFEMRYLRKDRSILRGDVLTYLHCDEQGRPRHFITSVVDVTERKQLEAEQAQLQAQLHQVRKLDAIGRLAGGIAHDFNNILGGISGYVDLLALKYRYDVTTSASLEKISASVTKATYLTRQLLTFARKSKGGKAFFDVRASIASVVELLACTADSGIAVEKKVPDAMPSLFADRNLFENCLLNLCFNARDAMPGGGRLTIATDCEALPEGAGAGGRSDGKHGRYIVVSVTDTGTGMDETTKKHLFEPFFTTKEEGTGLGLAGVYGFVKQHGGYVEVESEAGRGSVFTLHFPVAEQ